MASLSLDRWFFLAVLGVGVLGFSNYLLFHAVAEMICLVIFFSITILAAHANTISSKDVHPFFLFLGIASFFIGILIFLHTLAYKGMGVFPGNTANLATQLYIISRYMLSLSFMAAALFSPKIFKTYWIVFFYIMISVLLLLTVFYWRIFPACFIEGQGLTLFKIISEYIICTIFIGAIVLLYLNRANFDAKVLKYTFLALGFAIVGELFFTFYMGVYDFANMVGHLLQIISAFYIYRGLVETSLVAPYQSLFSELKAKSEETKIALNQANEQLFLELEKKRRAQQELAASRTQFQSLFHHLPEGLAYHKVLLDEKENIIDYVFLEANEAFAQLMGIKRIDLLGKRASQICPMPAAKWLPLFGQVALEGGSKRIEHYFAEKNKWMSISVYSPKKGYFATLFTDITELKNTNII